MIRTISGSDLAPLEPIIQRRIKVRRDEQLQPSFSTIPCLLHHFHKATGREIPLLGSMHAGQRLASFLTRDDGG